MGKWEDEDGIEAPADRAWKKAEREGAELFERERREKREREAAEAGVPGKATCPAGWMYIHRRGVPCPACGESQ